MRLGPTTLHFNFYNESDVIHNFVPLWPAPVMYNHNSASRFIDLWLHSPVGIDNYCLALHNISDAANNLSKLTLAAGDGHYRQ